MVNIEIEGTRRRLFGCEPGLDSQLVRPGAVLVESVAASNGTEPKVSARKRNSCPDSVGPVSAHPTVTAATPTTPPTSAFIQITVAARSAQPSAATRVAG